MGLFGEFCVLLEMFASRGLTEVHLVTFIFPDAASWNRVVNRRVDEERETEDEDGRSMNLRVNYTAKKRRRLRSPLSPIPGLVLDLKTSSAERRPTKHVDACVFDAECS